MRVKINFKDLTLRLKIYKRNNISSFFHLKMIYFQTLIITKKIFKFTLFYVNKNKLYVKIFGKHKKKYTFLS